MRQWEGVDQTVEGKELTVRRVSVAGEFFVVCLAAVVGLPLVGIGAGVAVVLFRGITGL